MSNTEDLKKRFEDLIAFIKSANDQAIAGKIGDLGDLEKTVTTLCQEVEKSEPEKAKEFKPLLSEMISSLDELESNLKAIKNARTKD